MLVREAKLLNGTKNQYNSLDEAIRTAQFIRNKAVRYWIDNQGVNKSRLYKLSKELASEFIFANKLNSSARQASIEVAWTSISNFYRRCQSGAKKKAVRPRDDESRKRSDPASPTARLRNADQERERAPREDILNLKSILGQ